MSVDGLRAWIGEVERKLKMRTRVFLVMAAIAIGVAGTAIYLAIDTRNDAVSEGDLQSLQQQLEGGAVAGSPDTTALQSEIAELRGKIEALESGGGGASKKGSNGGGAGAPGGGNTAKTPSSEPGSVSELREKLLQEAEKQK